MLKDFKLDHKNTYGYAGDVREKNMFILISLLHANNFINDKSIRSLFKSLREGKLIRRVNTYYSRVNKKWYSDENIVEIFEDVFNTKMNPTGKEKLRLDRINKIMTINGLEPKKYKTSLNFEESLEYLNLYLNKNRNYCIDHLFHEHIKPLINVYEHYKEYIQKMFNYDFSIHENRYSSSYDNDNDYCCSDCCGDYSDWVASNSSRRDYEISMEAKKEIIKLVNAFLNDKRVKYNGSYKEFTI